MQQLFNLQGGESSHGLIFSPTNLLWLSGRMRAGDVKYNSAADEAAAASDCKTPLFFHLFFLPSTQRVCYSKIHTLHPFKNKQILVKKNNNTIIQLVLFVILVLLEVISNVARSVLSFGVQ